MPERHSARRIALDVLDLVLDERRPLDEVFAGHPQLAALSTRDRGHARLLVATTLRRLGQIDTALDAGLRARPRPPRVMNLLRLGAAQLLFLSTPPHAAVAETVRLAAGGFRREMPMLNAVLRRLSTDGRTRLEGQDAARLNTPKWLWESWLAAFRVDRF